MTAQIGATPRARLLNRTGLAIAPGPVMFVLGSILAEVLQARGMRPSVIASVGSVIALVGVLLFTVLLGENRNYVEDFLPAWLPIGTGVGAAAPMAVSLATSNLRPDQASTGSAITSMMVTIGSAMGVSILVAFLGAASAGASLDTYRQAWFVSAGIMMLAIVAACRRRGSPTGR